MNEQSIQNLLEATAHGKAWFKMIFYFNVLILNICFQSIDLNIRNYLNNNLLP